MDLLKVKKCSKCKRYKELSFFGKDSSKSDGLYSSCKPCAFHKNKRYHRTKVGLARRIYTKQKLRFANDKEMSPDYSVQEFIDWFLTQPCFEVLYKNWIASNYAPGLKPSCDRVNDYEGYSFNNIQLITWQENKEKYYSDVKSGINRKTSKAVSRYTKDGAF